MLETASQCGDLMLGCQDGTPALKTVGFLYFPPTSPKYSFGQSADDLRMIAPAARMMLLATASFRKLRFLMIAYTDGGTVARLGSLELSFTAKPLGGA